MKRSTYIVKLFALFSLLSACVPIGKDIEQPSPLLFLVGVGQRDMVGVVSSAFSGTGRFSTISQEGIPGLGHTAIHSDARARFQGDRVYIINRLNRDSIQILNPALLFQTEFEYALEIKSNPHDFIIADESKAYITLFGRSELLVVHPRTGVQLNRINLTPYADPEDGLPEMSQMFIEGNRLFVTVARLDRNTSGFPPTDYSSLLEIDVTTDAVVKEHRLQARNPGGKLRKVELFGEPHLVFSTPSFLGSNQRLDGGVEAFNLNTKTIRPGFLYTETSAGGDILDVVVKNDTQGYAVVLKSDLSQSLQRFNPSSGQFEKELAFKPSTAGFISGILLHPNGRLYSANAGFSDPGVMIYDTNAGDNQLLPTPVNVGLPPQDLILIPGQ